MFSLERLAAAAGSKSPSRMLEACPPPLAKSCLSVAFSLFNQSVSALRGTSFFLLADEFSGFGIHRFCFAALVSRSQRAAVSGAP
jgi:hypothetical protein